MRFDQLRKGDVVQSGHRYLVTGERQFYRTGCGNRVSFPIKWLDNPGCDVWSFAVGNANQPHEVEVIERGRPVGVD